MTIISTNFVRHVVALYMDNGFLFGQNRPTKKLKPDRRSSGQPLRNGPEKAESSPPIFNAIFTVFIQNGDECHGHLIVVTVYSTHTSSLRMYLCMAIPLSPFH